MLLDLFSSFFFFKQKTAYEMRISDWSSDVCSSDLADLLGEPIDFARDRAVHRDTQPLARAVAVDILALGRAAPFADPGRQHFRARQILVAILVEEFVDLVGTPEIALEPVGRAHQSGRASWRERVCQYG